MKNALEKTRWEDHLTLVEALVSERNPATARAAAIALYANALRERDRYACGTRERRICGVAAARALGIAARLPPITTRPS